MDKNTLTRKIHICTADYDLCHFNAEKYLTFQYHNITFCCFLFLGYERCNYGENYDHCDTGSCCKIYGFWHCTGVDRSISECDSLSE